MLCSHSVACTGDSPTCALSWCRGLDLLWANGSLWLSYSEQGADPVSISGDRVQQWAVRTGISAWVNLYLQIFKEFFSQSFQRVWFLLQKCFPDVRDLRRLQYPFLVKDSNSRLTQWGLTLLAFKLGFLRSFLATYWLFMNPQLYSLGVKLSW